MDDLTLQGLTPILLAASSRSSTKTVEVLIKCKANVNDVDNKVVLMMHSFATLSFLYLLKNT